MSKGHTSTGIMLALALTSLIGMTAFVGRLYYLGYNEPDRTTTSLEDKTSLSSNANSEINDTKTHTDPSLSIGFSYPKDWLILKCKGLDNVLYLASDDRGLGIKDGVSIMCGGGTDFSPQASFYMSDEGTVYEGQSPAQPVIIDGMSALRYVDVDDGDGLRPAGFESTQYFVDTSKGVLVITYNRWPSGTEGYDSSESSKSKFIQLVESSLRFL